MDPSLDGLSPNSPEFDPSLAPPGVVGRPHLPTLADLASLSFPPPPFFPPPDVPFLFDPDSVLNASHILSNLSPNNCSIPNESPWPTKPSTRTRTSSKRSFPASFAELDSGSDGDVDEMEDDPQRLKQVIKRMRRQLREEKKLNGSQDEEGSVEEGGERGMGGDGIASSSTSAWSTGTPNSLTGDEEWSEVEGSVGGGQIKKISKLKKNGATGKKEATPMKVALNKAIRVKMRAMMGVDEKDPLPDPNVAGFDALGRPLLRPNWRKSVRNAGNKPMVDDIATQVIDEAWTSLRDPEIGIPRTQIPLDDLDKEIVLKATKTTWSNFSKKFQSENDPAKKDHQERDTKRRRRWARKDNKQKRRAKAAADPNYASHTYPNILRIDYMSSEYSSEGEHDESLNKMAPGLWDEISGKNQQPRDGEREKEEKILEVRTPRWRSGDLNAVYIDLEQIAAAQLKAAKGKAANPPTHRRFKLNPLRDLLPPEGAVQLWEYDPVWLAAEGEAQVQARERMGCGEMGEEGASGFGGQVVEGFRQVVEGEVQQEELFGF